MLNREAGLVGMSPTKHLHVQIKYSPDSYETPYTIAARSHPPSSTNSDNAKWQQALAKTIEKAARHGWINGCVEDYLLEYMYPDCNRCTTLAQRSKLYNTTVYPAISERNPEDALPTLAMACNLLLGNKLGNLIPEFVTFVDRATATEPIMRKAISLIAARALLGTSLDDLDHEWAQYGHAAAKALVHLYTVYTNKAHLGHAGDGAREAYTKGGLSDFYQHSLKMTPREASCLGAVVGTFWGICNHSDPQIGPELRQAMGYLENIPNFGKIKAKMQGIADDGGGAMAPEDFYSTSAPRAGTTWAYIRIDKPTRRRAPFKALKRAFPPTSATDARHMSTHVDAVLYQYIHGPASYRTLDPDVHSEDAVSSRVHQLNEVLKFIPVGTNAILTLALALTTLCSSSSLAVSNIYIRSRAMVRASAGQKAVCKALSSYIRKSSYSPTLKKLTPHEVSATTYYELCFGRSLNVSDWDSEKRNRTATTHHIQSPRAITVGGDLIAQSRDSPFGSNVKADPTFYLQLRKAIMEIIPPLFSKLRIAEPLKKFYGRRNDWISSGSSGGYKSASLGKLLGGPEAPPISVDKRVWAEEHDYRHIEKSLRRTPRERATASEKYENGKSRAIYGVAPEHYILNTYVTQGMEERLHKIRGLEKGAEGIDEMAFVKMRCNITDDPIQECVMLDYADFNIQHTLDSQWILFDCLLDQGISEGACNDWIDACKWIRDAKLNQQILFPKDKHPYKATQGMFSGTRSTDLINTILNLAYFKIANASVEVGGCRASDLYHVHQGDDVWLSSSNKLWGARLYYTMREQGFTFQDHKQMFGPGRGEYLRVLYDTGDATGYLARSLANYILHPIYNRMDLGGLEWVRGVSDTVRVLQRRGLDLYGANCLWQDIVHYRGLIQSHSADVRPLPVPMEYILAPVESGGMGCPPPGSVAIAGPIPEPPKTELVSKVDTSLLADRMARDWVSHVSAKLPQYTKTIRAEAIAENIRDNSYGPILQSRGKVRLANTHKAKWSEYSCRLRQMRKPPRLEPAANLAAALRLVPASCGSRRTYGGTCSLKYITAALDCNTVRPGTAQPWLNLSQTLNKYITQSTFKSTSKTALALGMTKTEALLFVLNETVDRSRANSDVISMVTQLIHANKIDWIESLLKGGSSVLTPLAQFADGKFINYFGSMLHQVLVLASLRQPYRYLSEAVSDHSDYVQIYARQLMSCKYLPQTILY